MVSAACFISGGVAPGAALQALLEKEAVSLASIDLICGDQQPEFESKSTVLKYNLVLAASTSPHSRDALVRIARGMAPGGRLYVYEAARTGNSRPEVMGTERVEALRHDLLLSGFTGAQVLDADGAVPAVWVFAQLPSWGLGASAKLSLKRPAVAPMVAPEEASAAVTTGPSSAAPAVDAWKLTISGLADGGDEELVDEELLLTAEDRKAAPALKPDDCEVGQSGRKACKNCSCGRAEAEAKAASGGVKLTADMLENPQSACGSCYLGDAFRCASCPYRGLPAFQPGEKITLGASMLTADI